MNFTCNCTIYLKFEIGFLNFHWEILFGVISGKYF